MYFSGIPVFEDYYAFFASCIWFVIASHLGFYEVYRYTKVISILSCTVKQAIAFAVSCLALAFFYPEQYSFKVIVSFTIYSIVCILAFKLFIYFFLRKFRILFGGNFRRVVLVGKDKSIKPLKHFLKII